MIRSTWKEAEAEELKREESHHIGPH